jgi:hypothetical protein
MGGLRNGCMCGKLITFLGRFDTYQGGVLDLKLMMQNKINLLFFMCLRSDFKKKYFKYVFMM